MCGRYTLIRLSDFTDMFPWVRPPLNFPEPRFNIAPTQPVVVMINDGKNEFDYYNWGLIPPWAKEITIGSRMINARVETLAEKPAFRKAFRRRRCLIPASGFYEWKLGLDGKTKTPMYIHMKDNKPFAFAGLWESWHSDNGSEIRSCTIITGEPNSVLSKFHHRMAVILDETKYQDWLCPDERDAEQLLPMLNPYAADRMVAHPVSRGVNNPKNDSPACIEPLEEPSEFLFPNS